MLDKEKINNELVKKVFPEQLNKIFGVRFSKHALSRLILSESKLSEKDLEQLKLGLEKAADKGSIVSLIIINDIAYIVSVKNSTVITVLSDYSTKNTVVDDIDSIVFM